MSQGTPGMQFTSRPKESERKTRRPLGFWDRIKLILLFGVGWAALAWTTYAEFQGEIPLRDALYLARQRYWWILVLLGVEVLRQIHFLIAEHSNGYYRFWNNVFKGWGRSTARLEPWTRYRVARAAKLVFFLVVLDLILAAFWHTSPATALVSAPARLVGALPFVLQISFFFFIGIIQFVGIFWFLSRGGIDTIMPDEIETRFTDVKGQDAVLQRVRENMIFLEDPESIEEKGGYVPGGILLWGPPGTGKTLMAQAVAGESAKPFVFVDPGAFINMFMGVGILKVKGLYRKLRKLATRYGGVIVFLDEADSLGNRGQTAGGAGGGLGIEPAGTPWTSAPACNGMAYVTQPARDEVFAMAAGHTGPKESVFVGAGMGGGGGMGTLQALLSEMSGLKKPRGFFNRIRRMLGMKPKPPPKYRILHIFATNMPSALDEAMLRPGRVDRIYKVGYPHKQGRLETLHYYLGKVKHELTDEQIEKLSTITPYATGATIQDMVNEGLVIAIRDGRRMITWADIIKAKQLKEHGLPDDHEYIERERHSVAVHEACHAVVAYRLRKHAVIDIATIERRGDIGGFVSSIPPEDQFVQWHSERDIDVMTFLASLAGERLFFDGDHSTGVGGDMRGATTIATQMLAYYAMGETMASRSVNLAAIRGAQPLETGADRSLFDGQFGKEVEARLGELYERTLRLIEENRFEILAVAHALETHRSITGDDVAAIIEGTRGSLIDGRPYRDSVFRQQLEEYHESVLKAHKSHAGVEGSIPIPIPPPPDGVLVPTGNGHGETRAKDPAEQAQIRPETPPRPDDDS